MQRNSNSFIITRIEGFWWGNLREGKRPLGRPRIHGRIKVKWALKK
jgi:hypothetical protein